MKIAICFFGLTRSLKFTHPSIKKYIFDPLHNNGIVYDIYLHTFYLKTLTNPRAGEINCVLDNNEYKLLEPITAKQIDDQNKIDPILNFKAYRSKGDPWKNQFKSLDNLLRQLYSLEQVTKLWESSGIEYDVVVYCRPDVKYLKDIDTGLLKNLKDGCVYVPSFLSCKGCNDRFAIGKPAAMKIYGNRRRGALEYSKTKPLHAETFLATTLTQFGFGICKIHFPFYRIRANGNVSKLDQQLAKINE